MKACRAISSGATDLEAAPRTQSVLCSRGLSVSQWHLLWVSNAAAAYLTGRCQCGCYALPDTSVSVCRPSLHAPLDAQWSAVHALAKGDTCETSLRWVPPHPHMLWLAVPGDAFTSETHCPVSWCHEGHVHAGIHRRCTMQSMPFHCGLTGQRPGAVKPKPSQKCSAGGPLSEPSRSA